jgi:predicted nucleic acid-binding protein
VEALIDREIKQTGASVGLVPQVGWEFIHVATDARRFDRALSMSEALMRWRMLWTGREAVRVPVPATVVLRTLELMETLDLGRKRILDTALAATLEINGISRLATINRSDFEVFPFLDLVTPA